jgi:hypothetical protein
MWMHFLIASCVTTVFFGSSCMKTSVVLYIRFCIYMTYSTSYSHSD